MQQVSFNTCLREFETYLLTTKRPHTGRLSMRALWRILDGLPEHRFPGDILRPDVIGYQQKQRSAGAPGARIDAELSALRQFYSWMRDKGIVDYNPAEKIPKLAPWKTNKASG